MAGIPCKIIICGGRGQQELNNLTNVALQRMGEYQDPLSESEYKEIIEFMWTVEKEGAKLAEKIGKIK